jgi:hypothetical protein
MRNRSFTLVQLIQDHAEDIASLAVEHIKRDPRLESMATIAHDELERRASNILRNLGEWLVATDPEIVSWAERLGSTRFSQSMPLNEVIRATFILKTTIIDFIRQQHVVWTAVQIYTEEETEHRIGRFFDDLVCHVARGYELARTAAAPGMATKPSSRPRIAAFAGRMRG